jgi:plastocyanin
VRRKMLVPVAVLAIAAPAGYAATEGAAGPQITIQGLAFQPKSKVVKPGVLVTWRNRDSVPHDATATKKAAGKPVFRTRTARGPATLTARAPRKTGRYAYICTVHPQMRGTLVVRR